MTRLLRTAALALVLLVPALVAAEEHGEGGGEGKLLLYRTINFLLLAGGLGYLIKKNAGPFFAARGEAIRSEIAAARKLGEESAARARAIEERLSSLDAQIADLRSAAKVEIAAEHARLEREAAETLRKVAAQSERDIAAAAKAARLELKSYAASLAIGLAQKKIAGRLTHQTQRALVNDFVKGLSA